MVRDDVATFCRRAGCEIVDIFLSRSSRRWYGWIRCWYESTEVASILVEADERRGLLKGSEEVRVQGYFH